MASKFQPPPDAPPDEGSVMSDEDSGRLLDQTRRALFAANPALASNDRFKGEFDDAFSEFIKRGMEPEVGYAKAWNDTVMPVIDKWQTVPQMPQMAKWQPNDVEKYKENLILAREASTSAAKSTDEDVKKSLTGIATNARKVIDDIEAKYPVPPKFQAVTDIPELPQGKRPSDLGFGAKYRVGNRVFQNFSPTPLPPGAGIRIGDYRAGSLAQPPPVAPGAPADDGSAPPMMPAPSPRFDPSNIMPQPGQSPATAGMVNVPGSQMFSAPPAPVAPAALSPSDEAQIMGVPEPKKPTRVRVTGPNGEKGTIEEGDKLPEGWKLE